MPLAAYSVIFSLFTGSFGITKFFVKGPLPILPQDAPLGGVLSFQFFILFSLNTMFVVRIIGVEGSLFSSYRRKIGGEERNIHALIPEEYRLLIYLLPGLVSLTINIMKLAFTLKPKDFRYFKKFPQFILCPMFCPLMFKGNQDQNDGNQPPIRVWKLGSILNSFFIGCLPQILLTISDHYKGVTSWDFEKMYGDIPMQDNNALLKHPYGNTILSITTFLLYLTLTTIFFAWDELHKKDGLFCTICKAIRQPFSKCYSSPISKEPDSSTANKDENPERDDKKAIENTSPYGNVQETENYARKKLDRRDCLTDKERGNPNIDNEIDSTSI